MVVVYCMVGLVYKLPSLALILIGILSPSKRDMTSPLQDYRFLVQCSTSPVTFLLDVDPYLYSMVFMVCGIA